MWNNCHDHLIWQASQQTSYTMGASVSSVKSVWLQLSSNHFKPLVLSAEYRFLLGQKVQVFLRVVPHMELIVTSSCCSSCLLYCALRLLLYLCNLWKSEARVGVYGYHVRKAAWLFDKDENKAKRREHLKGTQDEPNEPKNISARKPRCLVQLVSWNGIGILEDFCRFFEVGRHQRSLGALGSKWMGWTREQKEGMCYLLCHLCSSGMFPPHYCIRLDMHMSRHYFWGGPCDYQNVEHIFLTTKASRSTSCGSYSDLWHAQADMGCLLAVYNRNSWFTDSALLERWRPEVLACQRY